MERSLGGREGLEVLLVALQSLVELEQRLLRLGVELAELVADHVAHLHVLGVQAAHGRLDVVRNSPRRRARKAGRRRTSGATAAVMASRTDFSRRRSPATFSRSVVIGVSLSLRCLVRSSGGAAGTGRTSPGSWRNRLSRVTLPVDLKGSRPSAFTSRST